MSMPRTSLAALLVACLIGATCLGGWAVWRFRIPAARPDFVNTSLGPVHLRVHRAFVRQGAPDRGGPSESLELIARHPDFRPADALALRSDEEAHHLVFLHLQARDASLDPEERAAKLYVRFLEQDQWSHPGGLSMRRFEKGSPYEREELYFAPPEGRLFTARCMRPPPQPDGLPNTCVSELRLRGLDVQIRYSPDLLPEWEQLFAGARGLVESLTR